MPTRTSPTDVLDTGPMTTAGTEGGMIVPSEPPAQMVPQIRPLL